MKKKKTVIVSIIMFIGFSIVNLMLGKLGVKHKLFYDYLSMLIIIAYAFIFSASAREKNENAEIALKPVLKRDLPQDFSVLNNKKEEKKKKGFRLGSIFNLTTLKAVGGIYLFLLIFFPFIGLAVWLIFKFFQVLNFNPLYLVTLIILTYAIFMYIFVNSPTAKLRARERQKVRDFMDPQARKRRAIEDNINKNRELRDMLYDKLKNEK